MAICVTVEPPDEIPKYLFGGHFGHLGLRFDLLLLPPEFPSCFLGLKIPVRLKSSETIRPLVGMILAANFSP